jgi:hypothetical protein
MEMRQMERKWKEERGGRNVFLLRLLKSGGLEKEVRLLGRTRLCLNEKTLERGLGCRLYKALIRLQIPAVDRAALPKTELCVQQAEQRNSRKLYYALAYVAMHVFRQQTRI